MVNTVSMREERLSEGKFEELLDQIEDELEEIGSDNYRLRQNVGDNHDWHLQAGGDFNAYLDQRKGVTEHVIISRDNWKDESENIYEILDDAYDGLDWP